MASRRRVKNSHFFKVILSSTLEDKKLRIPEKFARIFGDELSTLVTLTIPNGQVWRVGLIKDGRKIWFHDGWHDFVQYNSISTGYFLVFKYRKNSNFKVLIFDMTACEIQYPYNDKGPENDHKQNSSHQDEMEDEVSVDIMDLTTPNPTFDSLKNKVSAKCPRSSSTIPSQLNQAKTLFGSAFGSPKSKHGYESQNKRLKMEELMEELVESNKSDAVGIDIKLKKTAYEVETHSSDDATKFDEDELMALLEDMGICVTKNFRSIAAEKRERAIAAARLFKPKNPSFMVISRAVDISLCRLYVPANFAHRYLSRNAKIIKVLDSDGRKWSMTITWMPLCFITKLGKFAKKLDDGDICVFELIRQKTLKFSVLKTSIGNPAKPSTSVSTLGIDESQEYAASLGTPEFKCGYDKRCKLEEPEEKGKPTTEDEDELLVLLEDMGICVNKKFRCIAAEEKERAIAAARLFKPKNPSFMLMLRSSDIHNCHFYVPAEFAYRYFSRIRYLKVLDSEGRKWPVEIIWNPMCFITRLGGFLKKLDEGDICVFELLSQKKLKVSILKFIES